MADRDEQFLAVPTITVAEGYRARVLVPPGILTDPLAAVAGDGDDIWVSDEGGDHGGGDHAQGNVVRVGPDGTVTPLVPPGGVAAPMGIDLAPPGFGPYAGHPFLVAQRSKGREGMQDDHVVMHVDPVARTIETFAHLGRAGGGTVPSSGGSGAGFGPDGTPFEGQLFVVTLGGNAVHSVTPDGRARVFAELDPAVASQPLHLSFVSTGGSTRMLVTASNGNLFTARPGTGAVVAVEADGRVLDRPHVTGFTTPTGIVTAPPGWGPFGGQLLVGELGGPIQRGLPAEGDLDRRGTVVRVDAEGGLHVLASGFLTPLGLSFAGERLLVCDIGLHSVTGGQPAPDGTVVEITPT